MTDHAQTTAQSDRITDLFDAWWQESFPFAPANKQTRENFIAFGRHVQSTCTAGADVAP